MAKKTEFAPMLAAKTPDAGFAYKFPLLISPKLDGIRAIVRGGVVMSRSLKPIPNKHVQALFGHPFYQDWDGELIVGAPTGRDENGDDVMQRTTKGVMRIEGTPAVTFHVFDLHGVGSPFEHRQRLLADFVPRGNKVSLVTQKLIHSMEEMDAFEASFLELGFEGAMLRDPQGLYKYGRSTAKEGGLIKIKRFEDDEAVIIGVEERMHNDNEKTVDNLGHSKRSTHQAGKRPAGDLGALICRTKAGVEFNIGTGFSQRQREELWAVRETLPGQLAKYKSFTAAGVKEAPRFPVWLSLRHPDDL